MPPRTGLCRREPPGRYAARCPLYHGIRWPARDHLDPRGRGVAGLVVVAHERVRQPGRGDLLRVERRVRDLGFLLETQRPRSAPWNSATCTPLPETRKPSSKNPGV